MKVYFDETQKEKEINKIYLEDDDVNMSCDYLEIEDDNTFALWGSAVIENEVYNEFKLVFQLLENDDTLFNKNDFTQEKLEKIMSIEWDWYDFDFN